MAAYAALVSLLNNIEQMMSHPRLSTSFDKNKIQTLLEKAGLLLDFIEGYNYGGGITEAVDVERKIAFASHAAEDVIESHIVDQIHPRSNEQKKMAIEEKKRMSVRNKIRNWERRNAPAAHAAEPVDPIADTEDVNQFDGGSNQLQHVIQDMDAIIAEANECKQKQRHREEQHRTHSTPPPMETGEETAMVGI